MSTSATINPAISDQNFEDVRRLVYKVTNEFVHRVSRGLNLNCRQRQSLVDEALSEAYYGYAYANSIFNPDLGRFTTCVFNNVRYKLLNWWNSRVENSRRFQSLDFEDAPELEARSSFDLSAWANELSSDGQAVVELLFDDVGPWSWKTRHGWQDDQELPKDPRTAGKAVKQRLEDLGWTLERITSTWNEIRAVLPV